MSVVPRWQRVLLSGAPYVVLPVIAAGLAYQFPATLLPWLPVVLHFLLLPSAFVLMVRRASDPVSPPSRFAAGALLCGMTMFGFVALELSQRPRSWYFAGVDPSTPDAERPLWMEPLPPRMRRVHFVRDADLGSMAIAFEFDRERICPWDERMIAPSAEGLRVAAQAIRVAPVHWVYWWPRSLRAELSPERLARDGLALSGYEVRTDANSRGDLVYVRHYFWAIDCQRGGAYGWSVSASPVRRQL